MTLISLHLLRIPYTHKDSIETYVKQMIKDIQEPHKPIHRFINTNLYQKTYQMVYNPQ